MIKFNLKFWLKYSFILILIVFLGGLFISRGIKNLVIADLLLLPVVLCFWSLTKIKSLNEIVLTPKQNWFLLYTLLVCSLITFGGFWITRSTAELISNLIFLPVTLTAYIIYFKQKSNSKGPASKIVDAFLKLMSSAAKKRGLE